MADKNDSPKNEFDQVTDGATSGTPPEDADRASRIRRSRGKVVDYVEADEELKEQMERIMEPIGRAPESFEAIITYGHPPLKKLGEIGNDMIKVQGKFNEQVNVMAGALSQLQSGLQGMNLDKFGEKTRELLASLAGGTAKGAKGLFKGLKAGWESVSGKAAKKTEDAKLIEQMQEALPQMLFDMIKLVKNIEETDTGIREVMKEAERLGIARVEATREIGVYLGASKEVLRRYNEIYIPEAEEIFNETHDPEDEMLFKDTVKRKEDFIDRITVLEGSRAASIIAAQQLRQIIETMEDQRKKIQDIIYNSQNEWKAMLAAAGIAGSSLKAAQVLKGADEFGDKMHDQTMKMIEEAHQMTLNGKARGTIDPAKLIEASAKLQQMIESENTARVDRLRKLEETAVNLRGAADRLLEAAESSNKARLLEASEDAAKARAKDAEKTKAEPVTTNDNAEPKSEAAVPKNAPKKTGTGPSNTGPK